MDDESGESMELIEEVQFEGLGESEQETVHRVQKSLSTGRHVVKS